MLTRLIFLVLVAFGGAALAFQAAWNARLKLATGSAVLTTIISIIVTLISLVLLWATGATSRGSIPAFSSLPKWAWLGGVCAGYYLIASLMALPKLGAAAVFSLVIPRQLIAALILDSTDASRVSKIALTIIQALGVALC